MEFEHEPEMQKPSVPDEPSELGLTIFREDSLLKWEWSLARKHQRKRPVIRPGVVADRPPLVKLTQTAYRDVLDDLGQVPFTREKAGLLMGPVDEDDLVTHYVPDCHGHGTPSSFTLDATGLNRALARFKIARLNCKGVVHVHPPGVLRPSFGDLRYVGRLFANPNNADAGQIILPIVCHGRLYPYIIDSRFPREVLVAQLVLI